MPIGLGIGLNISMRGGLGGGFSLTAPVLAFASATDPDSDNTQDFNITVTAPAVDDVLTLEWDNNSDFSSVTGSATYTIVTADLSDLTGEITTGALADGVQYFRARHSRGAINSPWSSTISKTITTSFDVLTLFASAEEGGWWDSSDLTTLFQHSNGTTAVASDADPVGYWGDKSGNGNHLTQAAEAAPDRRPTYTTAFGVKGDGTSDWMRVDNMSVALTTDYLWVIAVLRVESYIGTYDRIVSCSVTSGGADTGATAAIPITRDVADNGLSGFRNSAQKSQAALATGVKCVVDSLFDGTNHTLTLNGAAATPVSSTGAFNIDSFKIMADTAGNVSYANVSICELIMVNRVPAGTEQADLLSHLTTKWSV